MPKDRGFSPCLFIDLTARPRRFFHPARRCSVPPPTFAPLEWGKSRLRENAEALLDDQGAFHARLAVARDRAEVGVGARLQFDFAGFGAFLDHFDAAYFFPVFIFDFDVVGDRRFVGELDRVLAGLGGDFFGREGEVAARVGFDFDRRAAGGLFGFLLDFFGLAFGFFAGFFGLFFRFLSGARYRTGFFAGAAGTTTASDQRYGT